MPVGVILNLDGIFNIKDYKVNRNKGKSIIQLPDDYTVIDIETTGLSPDYDEIIELSAIKIRKNEIIDKFNTLIKPDNKIDEFITSLTGITNEMLNNQPKLDKILDKFIAFIGSDIVIGHNVNFDINFIYDGNLYNYNKEFNNNFVDTYRIACKLLHLPQNRLIDIATHYNIDITGQHRAMRDCEITHQIYTCLKQEILQKYTNAQEFYNDNWAKPYKLKATEITTDKTEFDTSHILYNKVCVFTGTLNIPRKTAMQCVVNVGGKCADNINKETNFLIMGKQDYSRIKNKKSNKILKAEEYILKGQDIKVLSEDIFYELIQNEVSDDK